MSNQQSDLQFYKIYVSPGVVRCILEHFLSSYDDTSATFFVLCCYRENIKANHFTNINWSKMCLCITAFHIQWIVYSQNLNRTVVLLLYSFIRHTVYSNTALYTVVCVYTNTMKITFFNILISNEPFSNYKFTSKKCEAVYCKLFLSL